MSTTTSMSREQFCELMSGVDRWAPIETLVEMLDAAQFWDDHFIGNAERDAKAQYIRRTIKTLKDGDDFPVWASVEAVNDEGKTVRIYKQEMLFDVDDYRQVVSYHTDRASHHKTMAVSYAKRCKKRFGKQLPLPI